MVGQGRFSESNDEASEMAITTSSGGSRGSRGVEVVVMVDALVALLEPTPESIGGILGANAHSSTAQRDVRQGVRPGTVREGATALLQGCERGHPEPRCPVGLRTGSNEHGLAETWTTTAALRAEPDAPGRQRGLLLAGLHICARRTIHCQFAHQTERLHNVAFAHNQINPP